MSNNSKILIESVELFEELSQEELETVSGGYRRYPNYIWSIYDMYSQAIEDGNYFVKKATS